MTKEKFESLLEKKAKIIFRQISNEVKREMLLNEYGEMSIAQYLTRLLSKRSKKLPTWLISGKKAHANWQKEINEFLGGLFLCAFISC